MKYRNKKVEVNGIKYDSKKEARRGFELEMLQRAGEISNLERQVMFQIEHNGVKICKYIADYSYIQGGKLIIEDVKSEFTKKLPVYRIKCKLMKAFHNIDIHET